MCDIKKIIFLLIVPALVVFSSCEKDEKKEPEIKAPLAMNPSNTDENSFTANWTGVVGADGYLLDVSADDAFTSYVDGYQAKNIQATSESITGLEAATFYYYRVRAIQGSTESVNSNIVKVATLIPDDLSLKDAANDFFVGTIVQSNRMTGTHNEIINREFSSISAEYEMKMNVMYPSEGTYNWTAPDAIVNYAFTNGINMHGHALIWHNATPDWVNNFSGTDAEFETMVENYIKTTVARYKGKVKSWDVVNEAFNDGSGTLRNSVFQQRLGNDYIAKCFTWAREADPDVLLFYNDYNMCSDNSKQNAVFDMADDLIARGIPIDGIGFQMHISYNWPDKADIIAAANRIVERDLLVHFSELDIRANPNDNMTNLTSERSLQQKEKYKEIAQIYSALPTDNKYALTIWGVKDNESWLLNHHGHIDWPLLYDSNANEKDAYFGFLEGLLLN